MSENSEFRYLAAAAGELGLTVPAPRVSRVDLGGGVSALSWGPRPAPVVLLHGAALNAHTWDDTLLAWTQLRHGRTGFLAIDLPGHGESQWRPDGSYTPANLAGQLGPALATAIAEGALASDFQVVGHSLGGLAALELSRETAFAGLVLIDILPLPPEAARTVAAFLDGPSTFFSRTEIVRRALSFGLGGSEAALRRGVHHNTRVLPDGTVVWKHHFGALGAAGLPVRDYSLLWQVIAGLPVSVGLVLATASLIDEATLARFTELRPASKVFRLPGGHNLQEDAPVPLAGILDHLIAEGT